MRKDQIIQADITEGISLPNKSAHCVVCSPPYWGLRDYGVAGQLGLEKTPEEYIERMVAVFRHVWRVLRDDGTCWLNMGDSYWNGGAEKRDGGHGYVDGGKKKLEANKGARLSAKCTADLKPKDLCMMPARLAIALQADGWYLRSDIIWAKPNPMPESCTDRPTKSHEHLFLLTKKPRYFYDADAVREPQCESTINHAPRKPRTLKGEDEFGVKPTFGSQNEIEGGRNKRDVWTIPTQSFPEAHFATFPEKLVEPCIKAGTSEKGCCPECGSPWVRVVEKPKPPKQAFNKTRRNEYMGYDFGTGQKLQNWLNEHPATTIGWNPTCKHGSKASIPCTVFDPFMGSGTVGLVAYKLNRHYIGTELNPEYIKMAEKRLQKEKDKYGLLE